MVSLFHDGVLPGDPEADLFFTAVILEALDEAREALQIAGLIIDPSVELPQRQFTAHLDDIPNGEPDISYVDDTVFVVADKAPAVTKTTAQACSIIHDVFAKFDLPLNFKPGKSEIVFNFVKLKSRQAKAQFFIHEDGLLLHEHRGRMLPVHSSDAYTHLGAYISANLSMMPEVIHRVNTMWIMMAEFRRCFYRNACYSPESKLATLHTLLYSRLFYNAAVWMKLNTGCFRKLNGAYLRCIHAVAGTKRQDYDDPTINQQALASTRQVPLAEHLRVLRLQFILRLMTHAPDILLLMLDVSPSWKSIIIDDLTWMQTNTNKLGDMPVPSDSLAAWLRLAKEHKSQWEKLCILVRDKFIPDPSPSSPESGPVDEPPCTFGCYECGAHFAKFRGLRMHARVVHKVRTPHLAAVHDTFCLACLKQHHSTDRLLQHLKSSPSCFELVSLNVPPMDAIDIQSLRDSERAILREARHAGKARPAQLRLPCIRLHGPLPKWATRNSD